MVNEGEGEVPLDNDHHLEIDTSARSHLMTLAFQVCQEFMDLKIPRHAEILDVAAGSGILSAELQTGG